MDGTGAIWWGFVGAFLVEVADLLRALRDGTAGRTYTHRGYLLSIPIRLMLGGITAGTLFNFDVACSSLTACVAGASAPMFLFDRFIDSIWPPR